MNEELPNEVDLDGHIDAKGIQYIGKASRQPDGTWLCLANVGGALCRVEVKLSREIMTDTVVREAGETFSAIIQKANPARLSEIWCALDKLADHAEARLRLALPTLEAPKLAPEPQWLTDAVDSLEPMRREVDNRTFACAILLTRAFVHVHPEATAVVEYTDDSDVLAIRWDDAAGLRFMVSRPPNLRWPAISARAYRRPDPESPRLECRYARLAHDLLAMPYEKVRDA